MVLLAGKSSLRLVLSMSYTTIKFTGYPAGDRHCIQKYNVYLRLEIDIEIVSKNSKIENLKIWKSKFWNIHIFFLKLFDMIPVLIVFCKGFWLVKIMLATYQIWRSDFIFRFLSQAGDGYLLSFQLRILCWKIYLNQTMVI